MKKTVTVNLNGRVFTMDEDAYQLLENYLKNLRIYFRKEEGADEIIADFEARIEELLSEKVRMGKQVIDISIIEEVISQVGNPSDFAADEEQQEERKVYSEPYTQGKKKFFRNPDDKMLGGVCSGVAAYFGWEVLPVRIIFLLLLFLTSGWFSLLYIVAWLVFPLAKTAEEKLQMRGEPITVQNIGKTVAQEAEIKEVATGFLNGLMRFVVALFKIIMIGILCLIGIPLAFAGIIVVIVLFAVLLGVGNGIIFGVDWTTVGMYSEHPTLSIISLSLLILIPVLSLLYSIVAYFAKFKPLHTGVKWTIFVAWIIALIVFLSSGFKKDGIPKWEFVRDKDAIYIESSGVPSDKLIELPLINELELYGYLRADLQIEQREGEETCLFINADRNFIDKVKAEMVSDRKLKIHSNRYRLRGRDNVKLVLQTPDIDRVKFEGAGNINFAGAFRSERLAILLEGVGNVKADSLYVDNLEAQTDGSGSMNLAGKSRKSRLAINGTGSIKALELQSDTIKVNVNGAGNVECNPVKLLDATVQGVGSIKYKEEPEVKNTGVFGVGSIKKY
jgi:Putative stress-responsive transcriptional regulator